MGETFVLLPKSHSSELYTDTLPHFLPKDFAYIIITLPFLQNQIYIPLNNTHTRQHIQEPWNIAHPKALFLLFPLEQNFKWLPQLTTLLQISFESSPIRCPSPVFTPLQLLLSRSQTRWQIQWIISLSWLISIWHSWSLPSLETLVTWLFLFPSLNTDVAP